MSQDSSSKGIFGIISYIALERSLLDILQDSEYNDLEWNSKVAILYYIINAKLAHKDFYSENILILDY
ncbi:24486_t:CDS:2 [Cetraspora pellucida]|uniref:24486_t:CDS:1 n=1 Tax=Cetraspora pellucida TaxID=1433469 RepID=A0A9N8WHS3_9GLOM|nr:24486_t:CDS:2 [Cetraspora pellucida]